MEPETWETHEVEEDLRDFLMGQFDQWLPSIRIYHEQVCEERDVTPHDEESLERLGTLGGTIYVVVYPDGPLAIIIAVVVTVAVVAAAFLLKPSVPNIAARNTQSSSPNNELAERQNTPRVMGRIPDIFGTVRSTPDLIAVPYKVFENNKELEVSYMCIGRGTYSISDLRDDTTQIAQIEGAAAEVYGPNTSPFSGHDPVLRVGAPITRKPYTVKRFSSVNGQKMQPPEGARYLFLEMMFAAPNRCISTGYTTNYFDDYPTPVDFTQTFNVGDHVVMGTTPTGGAPDLDGSYVIGSVSTTEITLVNPAAVNSNWSTLTTTATAPQATYMTATGDEWVGPFIVEVPGMTQVIANFIALNGMYKDDGQNQFAAAVVIEVEVTPVDASDAPTGPSHSYTTTMVGSSSDKETVAYTFQVGTEIAFPNGRASVRARRQTAKDTGFKGQVVDEVKWRDIYAVAPVGVSNFGDVTTALVQTFATDGALAVKDRKFNLLATRHVRAYLGGGVYSGALTPSNYAADILGFVCLDPYIGGRTTSELNLDNFYSTMAAVTSYFGTSKATEFCYTFDKSDMSFEEMVAAITNVVFCTAYRQGSLISLTFERSTPDSLMLFNHRNKVPNTEVRTIQFGRGPEAFDGVQFEWRDPSDDSVATMYVPQGMAAQLRPKKVQSIGIRNRVQAYLQAWRVWNKLQYQVVNVEFEATQEADPLIITQRVLVADNTRPDTRDGEVISQAGLSLALSEPHGLTSGDAGSAVISLQLYDGTVQNMTVASVPDAETVVLGTAPRLALQLADDLYARTTYVVTKPGQRTALPFLVTEKEPTESMTVRMRAINYDDRYYGNDAGYINGWVS